MAESPEAACGSSATAGIDAAQVAEQLERALICPVFTAHPSEARRRTILEKLAGDRPRSSIAWSHDRPAAARARARRSRAIAEEVETFWLSDTIRSPGRPSSTRSARGSAWSRGSLLRRRAAGLPRVRGGAAAGLSRSTTGASPPFLRFGSGSAATATATRTSPTPSPPRRSGSSRRRSCSHYLGRIDDLWRRLSHSDRFVPPGEPLRASLGARRGALPGAGRLARSTSRTGRSAG